MHPLLASIPGACRPPHAPAVAAGTAQNGETPLHVVCFAILVQDASKGPDTRWRQALRCSVQLVRGEVDAVELSGSPTPGHGAEEAEEGPSPPHFLSEWMNGAL